MHSSGIIRSPAGPRLNPRRLHPNYVPSVERLRPPIPNSSPAYPQNGPTLLTGGDKYGWQRKLRDLATPAESVLNAE